jgi:hypothetical protein
VTIWASQMRPGGLPAVCVETGAPADRWVRKRYSTAPRWTYLLLLLAILVLGVLAYFVARALVSVRASGQLPFARAVARRMRALSASGLLTFVGSLVVFVTGLAVNSGAVAVVGLLLFLVAVALLVAAGTIGPAAEVRRHPGVPNDRVVVLRRVHPDFAAAVLADQQGAPRSWPAS